MFPKPIPVSGVVLPQVVGLRYNDTNYGTVVTLRIAAMALKFCPSGKSRGQRMKDGKMGCVVQGNASFQRAGGFPNAGVRKGCLRFVLLSIKQYLKRIVKL